MFEKIRKILADIEDSQNEIEMLLKLANLSLGDFIEIKRGSMDMPKGVNEAFFMQLSEEVERLKELINALNKIKKGLLVF
ncbi:DUF2443 domain-containing protein [Helicobacter pylori]|uniref:DUF2443 domain-containing protein n=1 Tax=Helicobacter pylori TaxID=210 RepID=A0AB74KNJ1_HELPX|nr:DUF2443 family protein [Helicobacter pylori]EMG97998.1 hypothetical protein HMPREF1404_01269 [Helicobacter pylori GAM210Bi]MBM0599458.1 DUF2443 family protein [Helicobacter pylori]MCQ2680253.1 DUF2443 domain-containing protein [Helicobacter pylori]NID07511.1 DUF2443 family protein [Helicobacter pylori]PDW80292.1 hypothetical protein BB383_00670 [Helicobacter pylori]